MRRGMRGATAAAMTIAAVVASVVAPPSATAAAYRYWTYWQAPQGSWSFATAGPATTVPADGSVQGWRFAVTSAAGTASDAPRPRASFAEICADTPAVAGSKRVALVIDFGDPSEAPEGEQPPAATAECVVADADATGYAVLRSAVSVRTDDVGLICALADYPARGCAELVDEPVAATAAPASAAPAEAAAATADDPSTSPVPTIAAVAVIAAIAGAALAVARRRRS